MSRLGWAPLDCLDQLSQVTNHVGLCLPARSRSKEAAACPGRPCPEELAPPSLQVFCVPLQSLALLGDLTVPRALEAELEWTETQRRTVWVLPGQSFE